MKLLVRPNLEGNKLVFHLVDNDAEVPTRILCGRRHNNNWPDPWVKTIYEDKVDMSRCSKCDRIKSMLELAE